MFWYVHIDYSRIHRKYEEQTDTIELKEKERTIVKDERIKIERKTKETEISLSLSFEQIGPYRIDTTLRFFDHLLNSMTYHGNFYLTINACGDTDVDPHHLVEDIGIVFGDALKEIHTKTGTVNRYGHSIIPMDDALCEVAIDVCNRPYLVYQVDYPQPYCGNFRIDLLKEFFIALTNRACMNMHIIKRHGENSHHIAEAMFKALGKALYTAYQKVSFKQVEQQLSTKGVL